MGINQHIVCALWSVDYGHETWLQLPVLLLTLGKLALYAKERKRCPACLIKFYQNNHVAGSDA